MVEGSEVSYKKQRLLNIVTLYYSRPDVQNALVDFARNREITVSYNMENFGKRPDVLEYPSEIMMMIKKGATSFHCSEEIWKDPLKIVTGMSEIQANEIRKGWDLLIDIDSKYIDYSKIMAKEILRVFKFHGVKNIGIKFSGSKGFHLVVPWKAFPKVVNGVKTSDMFPEWARIILQYIANRANPQLVKEISALSSGSKYIKDYKASKEVIPDLVLVSPRHLFRMPYSLHEKTSLASVVLDKNKIDEFELKDADPMKVKIKNFYPNAEENEAKELLVSALDWWNEQSKSKEEKKVVDFKPIKLDKLSEKNFPPCVQNILKGVKDGRKRGVFVLLNLFRSVGMDREELEERISKWNKKNNPPLKEGYIKAQLIWSYRRKPIMPPNCQEFYKGLGICQPDDFCKLIKNPVNYVIRKSLISQNKGKKKKKVEKKS